MELASALVSRGLEVHGDDDIAMKDYQAAEDIFRAKRDEHKAMIAAEHAFAMSGALNGRESEPERGIESILPEDEPNVPLLIIRNAVLAANHMIESGDLAGARKYIELALSAKAAADGINKFMNDTWICHPLLAWPHAWRALIARSHRRIANKREKEVSGNGSRNFGVIDSEYKKALEIALFSQGGASDDFKDIAESYSDFLRKAGREEDSKRFEAAMKTMGDADIGTGGPEEWQHVLNCPDMSR